VPPASGLPVDMPILAGAAAVGREFSTALGFPIEATRPARFTAWSGTGGWSEILASAD